MNATNQSAFKAVAAQFRKQYGQESVTRELELKSSGLFGTYAWESSGAQVQLSVNPTTQMTSGMFLTMLSR